MHTKNEFDQPVGREIHNWETRQYPAKMDIQGKYCVLSPIDIKKHAKPLFQVLHDNPGDSWTYLPYGPFESIIHFKSWLKSTISEHDTVLYAILDVKTKSPIGICSYLRINPEHGVIEVGHLHYSQSLKRTPAATEAMYLMMCHAFDDMGYRRYEWKCNSCNAPSRRAAERLGFTFEGIFRQHYVLKNRNRDTAWFSILDSEWPAVKEKFIKWLSPSNFDHNGCQLSKLGE